MRGSAHSARHAQLRTLAGVVLISFSGVFVRLADVEAARSAFLRNAYALPALVVLVLWIRRARARRAAPPAQAGGAGSEPTPCRPVAARGGGAPGRGPAARRPRGGVLPLGLVPGALLAGLFLGGDLIAWHESLGIIGAGLGTVLPNLQVVFVAVAGVALLGERPRQSFWAALPAVLAGVWLLSATGRPVAAGASVPLGVGLGVLSALLYSGYLLVVRRARLRHPDAGWAQILTSATLGAALTTGLYAAAGGVAGPAGGWPADAWLVALALGSQVAGWGLLLSSIHRLPATLTSVVLLLQPLLALVWGVVLLDEPIGPVQLAGAAVLLVGVVVAHRAIANARLARSVQPAG